MKQIKIFLVNRVSIKSNIKGELWNHLWEALEFRLLVDTYHVRNGLEKGLSS
jgi:hypothetical protein